jgi:hypothetical protein
MYLKAVQTRLHQLYMLPDTKVLWLQGVCVVEGFVLKITLNSKALILDTL